MKTVLVVEDEDNLRFLYQKELREEGYAVLTASSAEEAIKELNESNVDLVILDLKLKGMTGLEALEEMLLKKRDLKVVINTAYSSYKDDFSSWLADAYLVKTSDLQELKDTVKTLLQEEKPH